MGQKIVVTARLVCSVAAVAGTFEAGCGRAREAERRASERATALAEDIAEETSLTSAAVADDASERASRERERAEIVAALRLEQSDYRRRLQRALDHLDESIARPLGASTRRAARTRELRARRDLLKGDLDALNRSTAQDWATLRARVERDLAPRRGPAGVAR